MTNPRLLELAELERLADEWGVWLNDDHRIEYSACRQVDGFIRRTIALARSLAGAAAPVEAEPAGIKNIHAAVEAMAIGIDPFGPTYEPALPLEEINALPENVRRYIMWLETDADPAGTLQENWRLTQENAALRKMLTASAVEAAREGP
jgi:hypothetical protein